MKRFGLSLFPMLAITQILGIALGHAAVQNVGDNSVYFTTYFSNANTPSAPDATVRIINDGDTNGNLWAAYYVFDDSQELSECCSCLVWAAARPNVRLGTVGPACRYRPATGSARV